MDRPAQIRTLTLPGMRRAAGGCEFRRAAPGSTLRVQGGAERPLHGERPPGAESPATRPGRAGQRKASRPPPGAHEGYAGAAPEQPASAREGTPQAVRLARGASQVWRVCLRCASGRSGWKLAPNTGKPYDAAAQGVTCAFVKTWVARLEGPPHKDGDLKGGPAGWTCTSANRYFLRCQDAGNVKVFTVRPGLN